MRITSYVEEEEFAREILLNTLREACDLRPSELARITVEKTGRQLPIQQYTVVYVFTVQIASAPKLNCIGQVSIAGLLDNRKLATNCILYLDTAQQPTVLQYSYTEEIENSGYGWRQSAANEGFRVLFTQALTKEIA